MTFFADKALHAMTFAEGRGDTYHIAHAQVYATLAVARALSAQAPRDLDHERCLTIEEASLFVICPVCYAGEEGVMGCVSEDGATTVPIHDERIQACREGIADALGQGAVLRA